MTQWLHIAASWLCDSLSIIGLNIRTIVNDIAINCTCLNSVLIIYVTIVLLILFIAATEFVTSINVSFNQSTYSVNESHGVLQPVLVLSESSSTDITVRVRDRSITATGKYTDI